MKENKITIVDNAVYLEPEFWGPNFWFVIESVILSMDLYDANSVESTYLFIISLKHTLPCPTCRNHYQSFIEANDVKNFFKSKKKIFLWIFKLQNEIKKRNNTKTFENFRQYLSIVKTKFNLKDEELKF